MYLKWQSRPRKRIGSPLLTAVLVESHRVGGKPRQRTVAYLAGILEVRIGSRHQRHHERFWNSVDARLDELGLDPYVRANIETSVAARVTRVTAENQAEFDAASARHSREISADLDRI